MKIDDPQVQKYISGQMSDEEERSFRGKLADHPEVADLAETLKRTARLIHEDKKSGETPYGLNLSEAVSNPQPKSKPPGAEDEEVPRSGLAFYSYKLMGNSWRFGITILSVTLATLFLLLVVVPFIRSASQVQNGDDFTTEFQKLVEQQKKNEEKGFISESRNIPTHGSGDTGAKARAQDLNLAAALDYLLDPSKKMLSAEVIEQISDLGKIGLNTNSDSLSASLPLAYETKLTDAVFGKIKRRESLDAKSIQPEVWINRLVGNSGESGATEPQITYLLADAPWSPAEKILFVQVLAPSLDLQPYYQDIWFSASDTSIGAATYQAAFPEKKIQFHQMESPFAESLDSAITRALKSNTPLIVLLQSDLNASEVQYLRQKLEQLPKLELRLIWGSALFSESARQMRSFFASSVNRGFIVHAPTPSLTQKAIQQALTQAPRFWTDARLTWSANKTFWTSSQVIGSGDLTNSQNTSGPGWFVAGDHVLTAIRLRPKTPGPAQKSSGLGSLNFQYRRLSNPSAQIIKLEVESSHTSQTLTKEQVQFASLVLWLGLGLKNEIEVSPDWLQKILEQSQTLKLPSEFSTSQQEFTSLLEALR